jgi:uncharacterized protein (TIGR02646 family)
MQHRICSYCGMATNGLDVEHFRPKGSVKGDPGHAGYWWLAYDSSNYFLACNVCNSRRKSTSFPLEPGTTRIAWDTRLDLRLERRILLDPAEDAVEDLFELQLDDPTCALFPNSSLDSAQQARVQFVIDFFALNLDPEVRKRRALVFEKALRAAQRKDWKTLRTLAMPHNEHSFAAWFVLRAIAPQELSSPKDELRNKFENLWMDLRGQIGEILRLRNRDRTPAPQDQVQLQSICWALLILRNQSPTDDTEFVARIMTDSLARELPEVRAVIVECFRLVSNSVRPFLEEGTPQR